MQASEGGWSVGTRIVGGARLRRCHPCDPDGPGVGKIALTEEPLDAAPPVSRQDVAWAAIEAIKLGISRKVIGFVGGGAPIEQALRA